MPNYSVRCRDCGGEDCVCCEVYQEYKMDRDAEAREDREAEAYDYDYEEDYSDDWDEEEDYGFGPYEILPETPADTPLGDEYGNGFENEG